MVTILFIGFVAMSMALAVVDWRKGWFLAILVGILQDPVRKMTPGTPAIFIMSIALVYFAVLLGMPALLKTAGADFKNRFSRISELFVILAILILFAALNGLLNFGLAQWKIPALALFIYAIPIPAFLLGYAYFRDPDHVDRFMQYYCVITSIAMIGVPLEYLRFKSPILGTVALGQDWIRHLPGVQVRILSGIYRSPDIMAWHAAMLTAFSLTIMVRRGFPRGWIWMSTAAWGFVCCMLSGRRKMIYMIAVFALVFFARYLSRMSMAQRVSIVMAAVLAWTVVGRLSQDSGTSVYTKGAVTSRVEILQRLEGGTVETIRQFGFLGLGLGAATQGVQHLSTVSTGAWQEGGAGKIAVELGLPGLLFAVYFLLIIGLLLFKQATARDESGNFRILRLALFAIFLSNGTAFLVSHQPFSDPNLVLMNAFLIGALFSMPRVEQPAATEPSSESSPLSAFSPRTA